MDWQPIETAPSDGQNVLLWDYCFGRILLGFRHRDHWMTVAPPDSRNVVPHDTIHLTYSHWAAITPPGVTRAGR